MPLGLSQVLQALFLVHHVGPPANVRRQAALRSTAGGRWCPKRRGNLSIVSDKGVMNCVWALVVGLVVGSSLAAALFMAADLWGHRDR